MQIINILKIAETMNDYLITVKHNDCILDIYFDHLDFLIDSLEKIYYEIGSWVAVSLSNHQFLDCHNSPYLVLEPRILGKTKLDFETEFIKSCDFCHGVGWSKYVKCKFCRMTGIDCSF